MRLARFRVIIVENVCAQLNPAVVRLTGRAAADELVSLCGSTIDYWYVDYEHYPPRAVHVQYVELSLHVVLYPVSSCLILFTFS